MCTWCATNRTVSLRGRRGCHHVPHNHARDGEEGTIITAYKGLRVVMELDREVEVWSGGVHVTLDCARDDAWAIFGDFGGFCKWNPAVTVCDLVEGKGNEPGSVRYCRGTLPDSWVYERLLVHDEKSRLCKYRMEDNRFRFRDGVQGYVSQIQFREAENGKTFVDWTYAVHPVATQTREQFTAFMTGFYLYNLNILESAANASRASFLDSDAQEQQSHRTSALGTCKPLINA